mmetsp:Transcript_33525/g.41067  ORF Transcript_33525/g.41067 Transcript_33525/m.41067 type:complete len:145 (+) Transcript_33525:75-509(+)
MIFFLFSLLILCYIYEGVTHATFIYNKAHPGINTIISHTTQLNYNENSQTEDSDIHSVRKNLELKWQIGLSLEECDLIDIRSCGTKCATCDGEGISECRFCGGTGFFTIGDVLVGGGKSCLICGGGGEEKCQKCRGNGWIAKWR